MFNDEEPIRWDIEEFLEQQPRMDIFYYVEIGDDEKVLEYLSRGGDVNAENDAGISLLSLAIQLQHLFIIQILIEYGATIPSVDVIYTGLYSQLEMNPRLLVFLIKKGMDISNGLYYTQSCENVSILFHYGVDPNGIFLLGEDTPLIQMILNFDGEEKELICIVSLFIQYGADVNTQNANGDTAIHMAAEREFWKVMDLLLLHGARVDIENAVGETFLDIVSWEYYYKRFHYIQQWMKTKRDPLLDPRIMRVMKEYLMEE